MTNKVGRPTKYTKDMPVRLFEAMSEGRSVLQFAHEVGVDTSTVYRWAEAHPDFRNALTRGKQAGEAYWEGELQKMMYSKDVNAPLVKLYFANRFNWHDRQNETQQERQPINFTFQTITKE